jgi:hypothetical protein
MVFVVGEIMAGNREAVSRRGAGIWYKEAETDPWGPLTR